MLIYSSSMSPSLRTVLLQLLRVPTQLVPPCCLNSTLLFCWRRTASEPLPWASMFFINNQPSSVLTALPNALKSCVSVLGLVFLDVKGKPVFIYAASWRASYVLSAQTAGVDSEIIDATGRWVSTKGRRPYTFDTAATLRATADRRPDRRDP